MNTPAGWALTGDKQHISGTRQEAAETRFDAAIDRAVRLREHLWIAVVPFFVTPPLDDGAMLDAENIASAPSVGCYVCEEPWDERVARRRCPGDPTGLDLRGGRR
jgi:hypothetical protein